MSRIEFTNFDVIEDDIETIKTSLNKLKEPHQKLFLILTEFSMVPEASAQTTLASLASQIVSAQKKRALIDHHDAQLAELVSILKSHVSRLEFEINDISVQLRSDTKLIHSLKEKELKLLIDRDCSVLKRKLCLIQSTLERWLSLLDSYRRKMKELQQSVHNAKTLSRMLMEDAGIEAQLDKQDTGAARREQVNKAVKDLEDEYLADYDLEDLCVVEDEEDVNQEDLVDEEDDIMSLLGE